jgi:hypothetical protein
LQSQIDSSSRFELVLRSIHNKISLFLNSNVVENSWEVFQKHVYNWGPSPPNFWAAVPQEAQCDRWFTTRPRHVDGLCRMNLVVKLQMHSTQISRCLGPCTFSKPAGLMITGPGICLTRTTPDWGGQCGSTPTIIEIWNSTAGPEVRTATTSPSIKRALGWRVATRQAGAGQVILPFCREPGGKKSTQLFSVPCVRGICKLTLFLAYGALWQVNVGLHFLGLVSSCQTAILASKSISIHAEDYVKSLMALPPSGVAIAPFINLFAWITWMWRKRVAYRQLDSGWWPFLGLGVTSMYVPNEDLMNIRD